MSPLALARSTAAGTRTVYLLGLCGAVRGLALVLLAQGVAGSIVAVIQGSGLIEWLAVGLIGGFLRALEAWAGPAIASAGAVGVKEHWRHRLTLRALVGGGRDLPVSSGALAVLATRGLDDVDEYFQSVLPALLASATVPVVLWIRIAFEDWVSALILVLTLPLVPVFMILIGRYTVGRVERAQQALDRISHHLTELVRGLPVLIGLGRAQAQTQSLRAITREYRESTVSTLRVAFLSALALELIASLSVALIAVFIGVRLVGGSLGLEAGLLVLILAPEVFLPLRQLGSAFHAAENGQAAQERAQALADQPAAPDPRSNAPGHVVEVKNLSVKYPDRSGRALTGVDLTARPGRVHLIDGASGAGKSTLLAVLAGLQREGVSGTVDGVAPHAVAFLPQAPVPLEDTAGADVQAFLDHPAPEVASRALSRAGLPESFSADPALMSPGELRRLGLARVFARVEQGARVVLLDEPTAHLDPVSAESIARSIRGLGDDVVVLVASHDRRIRDAADDRTALDESFAAFQGEEAPTSGPRAGAPGQAGTPATPTVGMATLVRRWVRAVNPASPAFLGAVLAGVGAAVAAAALTAVSGWLIVRASFQPPIMLLLVAIVGVRFFGLARAVLRYCERLWMHEAVLRSLEEVRLSVWGTFAHRGTAMRSLLRPDAALRTIVTELDDIRDLTPRVTLPPLVALLVAMAAVVTGMLIHPRAGLTLALFSLVALLAGSVAALLADRRAFAEAQERRGGVLGRLARLLAAREDLAANGREKAVAADLLARDRKAEGRAAASARAAGLAHAVVVLCGVGAALLMPFSLASAVASGQVAPELLAVCTLLPLALVDPFTDAVQAIRRAPALARLLATRDDFDEDEEPGPVPTEGRAPTEGPGAIDRISLRGVGARWKDAPEPVFEGVDLEAGRGDWVRVSGPSGSGKTTLVSVLLRFLDPESGTYALNGEDATRWRPAGLEGRMAWCPQEAHIFDSTLRANLLLARPRGEAPSDQEMWAVLGRLGLAPLVDSWPHGLDERLGAGGSLLSGGERQRVAVARTLLTGARALVLDEPVAHLDAPTAERMMGDVRQASREGIVVEVTHSPEDARAGDLTVELTGLSPSSRRT